MTIPVTANTAGKLPPAPLDDPAALLEELETDVDPAPPEPSTPMGLSWPQLEIVVVPRTSNPAETAMFRVLHICPNDTSLTWVVQTALRGWFIRQRASRLRDVQTRGTLDPMDTTAIVERAAKTNSLLVATDFDGTIADITTAPTETRARADALAVLSALNASPGVHIAVVSGRDFTTLKRLTAALGSVYRVSEHGAFIEAPDGSMVDTHAVAPADVIDRLDNVARDIASRVPGMRVEHKMSGVAVHVREIDPSRRQAALVSLESFRREATRLGLVVMDGRQVIEARSARASKQAALQLICDRLSSETFVLYAGDDTTDEGAITLASRLGGAGIYVASAERPEPSVSADAVLAAPRAWIEMLEALAAARALITSR